MENFSEYLAKLRNKLLDLTARNRFISFRFTKKSSFVLTTATPDEIYKSLTNGDKDQLKIKAIEYPTKSDIEKYQLVPLDKLQSGDWDQEDINQEKYIRLRYGFNMKRDIPLELEKSGLSDGELYTTLYPEDLVRDLGYIHHSAISAIEERGTSITYLSFGFLEWSGPNSNSNKKSVLSPLYLFPITLNRKGASSFHRYDYLISSQQDEPHSNETLKKLLRKDYNFDLPDIAQDETPEQYMSKVQEAVKIFGKDWHVRRYVSICLLDFSKLAMFQDLDPQFWPDQSLLTNKLIHLVIAGDDSSNHELKDSDEIYDIDQIPKIESEIPLVLDADSSQYSAIIDACHGHNLVIVGPPGTGKSQTITNLIATLLYSGKTVLFASEKLAALSVVKSKLDHLGLGFFCLELHSNKVDKAALRQSLKDRLEFSVLDNNKYQAEHEIEKYLSKKQILNDYAKIISQTVGNSQLTIGEVLRSATRYRPYCQNPRQLRPSFSFKSSSVLLENKFIDVVKDVQNQGHQLMKDCQITEIADHPWYGITNDDSSPTTVGLILTSLDKFQDATEQLLSECLKFEEHFNLPKDSLASFENLFSLTQMSFKDIRGNFLSEFFESFIQVKPIELKEFCDQFANLIRVIAPLKTILSEDFLQSFDFQSFLKELELVGHTLCPTDMLNSQTIGENLEAVSTIEKELKNIKEQLQAIRDEFSSIQMLNGDSFCSLELISQLLEKGLAVSNYYNSFDPSNVSNLKRQLSNIKADMNQLMQLTQNCAFNLKTHPDSNRLSYLLSTLRNGGIFAWFKSEWRDARREIISYGKGASYDDLMSQADNWLKFIELKESINTNCEYEKVFGPLFKGINTDTHTLELIIDWYEFVVNLAAKQKNYIDRKEIYKLQLLTPSQVALLCQLQQEGFNLSIKSLLQSLESLRNKPFGSQIIVSNDISNQLAKSREVLEHLLKWVEGDFSNYSRNDVTVREWLAASRLLAQLKGTYTQWSEHHFMNDVSLCEKFDIFGTAENIATTQKALDDYLCFLNSVNNINHPLFEGTLKKSLLTQKVLALNICSCLQELKLKLDNFLETKKHFTESGQVTDSWLEQTTIHNLIDRNNKALQHRNYLSQWTEYFISLNLLKEMGLGEFVDAVIKQQLPLGNLLNIYLSMAYDWLGEELIHSYRILEQFKRSSHESTLSQFVSLDKKLNELMVKKIQKTLLNVDIPCGTKGARVSEYSEMYLIKNECNKKKRFISNRELFKRASRAIQAMKPCFMMSPLSVAQTLVPGEIEFDVVVMDEASQLTPESALGVIARGKQVIIVGDPNQLPPTNFFNSIQEVDPDEDAASIFESESILDQALLHLRTRRLTWHYRSRHESLIAFSNKQFYNGKLMLFPSPKETSSSFGVKFKYIGNGVFNDNNCNPEEAKHIAMAVINHAKQHPEESFGVVAMNEAQRNYIEEMIDQMGRNDPVAWNALASNRETDMPYFVKNLENVQGDERDVIFISMTYGPKSPGGVVPQRFGPINQDNGWRRLNVLLTRSRKRMMIYSSMKAADITNSNSRGTIALHDFLEYCETGKLPVENSVLDTGRGPDSDFEISVIDALNDLGYQCQPQVGVAGFFIDIAVRDPNDPNTFLLGIECDGATYHSSKSARDRDRLRQQVLEGLGWKIHRIWSTDWFLRTNREIETLALLLEKLVKEAQGNRDSRQLDVSYIEDIESSSNNTTLAPKTRKQSPKPVAPQKLMKVNSDEELRKELRKELEKLRDKIRQELPGVSEEKSVLTSPLINYFIDRKPKYTKEFVQTCPYGLRERIHSSEAKYLPKIYELIKAYS